VLVQWGARACQVGVYQAVSLRPIWLKGRWSSASVTDSNQDEFKECEMAKLHRGNKRFPETYSSKSGFNGSAEIDRVDVPMSGFTTCD
jgi:hypothetical protein